MLLTFDVSSLVLCFNGKQTPYTLFVIDFTFNPVQGPPGEQGEPGPDGEPGQLVMSMFGRYLNYLNNVFDFCANAMKL